MSVLRFVVPGPPVGKQRPRLGAKGGTYTPRETVAYERSVATYCLQAIKNMPRGWSEQGRYRCTLDVFFADERRRDLDNVAKAVMDACNALAWKDDSQLDELHVYRWADKDKPRVEVAIGLLVSKVANTK